MSFELDEKPNYQMNMPPQMFAIVGYNDKLFCAPAVSFGDAFAVFADNQPVEIISFCHRDKILGYLKIFPGSETQFQEFQNLNVVQMLYAAVTNVFISQRFRDFSGKETYPSLPGLKQDFINFLVYLCKELHGAGVSDFSIQHEMQKFVGMNLYRIGMQDLLYEISALFPPAIEKFVNEMRAESVQNEDYNEKEISQEDFTAMFGGMFSDDDFDDDDEMIVS